jgi:hypothetical protein
MTKEFIPYEQALALKELGFDEPCFSIYYSKDKSFSWHHHKDHTNDEPMLDNEEFNISAPLYQQTFRWFREKYQLHQYIKQYYGEKFYFHIEDMVHPRRFDEYTVEILRSFNESASQEEAELECLKKLIELVKQ